MDQFLRLKKKSSHSCEKIKSPILKLDSGDKENVSNFMNIQESNFEHKPLGRIWVTGEKQKFENFGASPFAYSGSKQLSPSKISNSLEIKGELTLGYPSAHKGAESDTEGSENVKERLSDLYESTNVSTRIPRTSKLSEKIQSFSTRFKDQAFNYTPDHVYKSSVSTGYGIFRPD